ncbi:hypothetical protein F3J14_20670 [Burkholderia sp. Tr-862]|nr:hypothetical protein [Burkholderia sp. Tr-862]
MPQTRVRRAPHEVAQKARRHARRAPRIRDRAHGCRGDRRSRRVSARTSCPGRRRGDRTS